MDDRKRKLADIRRKYTSVDYQWNESTGKEEKVVRIISEDIAFLFAEIKRLVDDHKRLHGLLNGRAN